MIAILGSGAHGGELARIFAARGEATCRCDDLRDEHVACDIGAARWPWVVGTVWPEARRAIAGRYTDGDRWQHAHQGGTVVSPGAVISEDAVLGQHVYVGPNVVVSHGCRIGAYTSLIAGSLLGGEVTVEPDVVVGAGAVIIHGGITIGRGAFVGALTAVIDDVPPGAVVAGNPGKVVAHDWDYRDMAAGRRGRQGLATPR